MIIFIIDSLNSGGAQKQIVLLANYLSMNNRVELVYYAGNDHFKMLLSKNVLVRRLSGKLSLASFLFRKMLINNRVIYYSYLNNQNIIVGIIAILTRNKKVIISERGEQYLDSKIRSVLMRLIVKNIKYLVVNSEYLKILVLKQLRSPKVIYIPNIINNCNVSIESKLDTSKPIHAKRIGIIGRFAEEKNQCSILELCENLKEEFELIFIGDVSDNYYKKFIIKLNKFSPRERVKVISKTNDVQSFYQNIDFIIIPSKRESFPNVLIESYMNCKPVISAYVGENIYILKNNKFGYLYKNKAEFKLHFNTMIKKSDMEINEMGNLGRKYIIEKYLGVNEFLNEKIISEITKSE